jgi:predicted MFS family arabinose efflux permease
MERTLTSWLALELGANAFEIGLTFAARMVPSLLFGLAAGTLADRADRPKQLLAVGGGALFLMMIFGWLTIGGTLQIWQVIMFSFAAGCIQVFDTPARQALVLDTVSNETALSALALNALAARFSSGLGSIAGGALITLTGIGQGYFVVAVIYGFMGALVGTLRVSQAHRTTAEPPPFRQAFRDAVRLMADVPVLRTLMVVGLICEICAFSHFSALPLFAQQVLRVGPEGLGTLNGAGAIGGAISVALLAMLPERMPRKPLLAGVFLAYGISITIFATTQNLLAAAALLLVSGFCAGAFDVLQQTLMQMAVPPEQRGRAVGLWVLSLGSAPVGHLEMGALAGSLGVPVALLLNGLITIVSAVALLLRAPTYRWRRQAAYDGL